MSGDQAAIARQIIDANSYLTLASADADGRPWASPVWFACSDSYDDFYWVSLPDAVHSVNLASRPETSFVIFDSTAKPLEGRAVYVAARAAMVADRDLPAAIEVYSARSMAQGLGPWGPEQVTGDAALRLYRATAEQHWILDADNPEPGDHRLAVRP